MNWRNLWTAPLNNYEKNDFNLRICEGEEIAYTETESTWAKNFNCTPYTIIFETEANDGVYDIFDKKGKRVGVLHNFKGFFDNFYF